MRSFFIGLQFLTRISVVHQDVWTEEDFGKSVRWFPLIGAVLGLCYAVAAYLLLDFLPSMGFFVPSHLAAALLAILPILLTGGIHCDGFMDTVDGLFSGRSRERMLEIMKDSSAGSYAVVAFAALLLLVYSMLLDLPAHALPSALFAMPVIGRCMMVLSIGLFPYARPEGIGKAFSLHTGTGTMLFATLTTAILLAPWGWVPLAAFLASLLVPICLGRFATKNLGGVTGDIYGATELLSEATSLLTFLLCTGG